LTPARSGAGDTISGTNTFIVKLKPQFSGLQGGEGDLSATTIHGQRL